MICKSLKTEFKSEALKEAVVFWKDLIRKEARDEPLVHSPNFKLVAEDLFKVDQERVIRGECEQSTVNDAKYIYNADFVKFFGKMHCKDIGYQTGNDFIEYLNSRPNKKRLKAKTIQNHFMHLNKIMAHARNLGYIDQAPSFPKIEVEDNPRGDFNEEQYSKLLATLDEMIVEKTKVRGVPVTMELKYLVRFMFRTFLRPGDAKLLQRKHIVEMTTQANNKVLKILCLSKVKPYTCISMPAAVATYSKLAVFNVGFTGSEDYVFFPRLVSVEQTKEERKNNLTIVNRKFDSRGYAMSVMGKLFTAVLERANLKIDHLGQQRTLYSLRHTAIMDRLRNGVTYDDVAKNAGTSGEMVRRFYGSHLTSEMNADRLIANKPVPKKPEPTMTELLDEFSS